MMAEEESKALNYIPEIILKKRKSSEAWALRKKEQFEQKKFQSKKSKDFIKKPEDFILEHRNREMDLIRMKRRVKRTRHALLTPESKLLIIIRIQGKNDMHPKTRRVLYSLGLRRIFSAVFVKATEGIMAKLQRVEPFVTYGIILVSGVKDLVQMSATYLGKENAKPPDYVFPKSHTQQQLLSTQLWNAFSAILRIRYPNLKSIKDLIYKKGHVKLDKQKVPLTDNNIIQQELGKFGIVCIEDMVHEIKSVGPHFKEVASFLWPFELNKPAEGLQGSKTLYKDGGDTGNREHLINELLNKMN